MKAKMSKGVKAVIIVTSLIILSTGAYLFWKRKKTNEAKPIDSMPELDVKPTISEPIPVPTVTLPTKSFPIVNGSTGKYIEYLQKGLNLAFKSGLTVDGIYGNKTAAALMSGLKRYQINSQVDYNNVLIELNKIALKK